jgi:hypothetical protein
MLPSGHHAFVPSTTRLAFTLRRLAASLWTAALLVFSTFQWVWTNYFVSLAGVAALILLSVVIPRTRWGQRGAESGGDRGQGLEWLLGMLFWASVWAFHGIEHRPEQAAWALVSAAIFLLYAVVAFLDWRARVSDDRRRGEDLGIPR